MWNAPEQLRLITVNQEKDTVEFADKIAIQAKALGLRVNVDNDNESVGKKIRSAEISKVPYSVVLGEKEMAGGELTPRVRQDLVVNDTTESYAVERLLQAIAQEAQQRVTKSSL